MLNHPVHEVNSNFFVQSGYLLPVSNSINQLKAGISNKALLWISYSFILLILIDAPLVVLNSLTGATALVKFCLYGSEFIILATFGYLLLHSFHLKLPHFIWLYVFYILMMTLMGLIFGNYYGVLRDSRRYLALLPPLLLGYYFSLSFGERREDFVDRIVIILTILSVIGLAECLLFYLFPGPMTRLYGRFLNAGIYFASIKHTSCNTETGLLSSGLTQEFIRKFGFDKRATGIYLEPYSASFNAAMAIILIMYGRIAGYRLRKYHIFVAINLAAVIFATSRSAYLFLYVALFIYVMIQRKTGVVIFLCIVPLFSDTFRDIVSHTIETLGGGMHKEAIVTLPDFFSGLFDRIFSLETYIGAGFGASNEYADHGAIREIIYQLGVMGLIAFVVLYFTILTRIPLSRENKFFVLTSAIVIFLLCIYSGRIFGYKSLGLLHFFLGYIAPVPLKNNLKL